LLLKRYFVIVRSMFQKIFLIIYFVFFSTFLEANTLQKTLSRYSKAKGITAEIIKTDEKVILGTKSQSKGQIKFQKNKIYISQEGEKKTEFYFVDKVLTLVEYPDADFDKNGARKVTTIKKSVPPLVSSLLNLFSNPKAFTKEFKTINEKSDGNILTVDLKPTLKNIKSLSLKINSKKNEIVDLEFTDDVDTKTTISFSNLKLNAKLSKKDFQFKKLDTDEEMID
jgi:outer membrane lipoprotein-sorting protein